MLEEKGESLFELRRENGKVMNDFRKYWRAPRLTSELSEEQRKKVTEKFLDLVEKSKEEDAKRMSRVMQERKRLLRAVIKGTREK